MDFCTSTPLVVAKQNSSRVNNDNKLNQKLFINNPDPNNNNDSNNNNNNSNNNNNNNIFFDEYWEKINGPKFVDFANGIPEPRDSFFDGRQSICPTPVKEENFLHYNNDLINTLENFSLGSENDDDVEDITLKADTTVQELNTNETSVINCGDTSIDRRLSRLSTTPQPFSFESREKDKQERKLAKKQFLTNDHEKQTGFKARPAPKFKNPIRNPIKQIKKEEKRPVREEVPRVKNEVKSAQEFFNWKKETKPVVCKGSIKEEVISPINLSPVEKVDKSVSCTIEELESQLSVQVRDNDGSAEPKHRKKIEVWNQKPFQVNLPKRRILVPKSPKLRTAERARERKLFEEKLKKREKDFEEFHKILSETQREKEKDEIARLRQQATFKARPMPKYPDVKVSVPFKRPLVNPPIPQITKRPRRNEN
ncbi:putative uncharacterized protein DDB_G0282133 isoform X2 [Microplitis mediator]|uniref:putative uncharacterized protein DDB_G0282133 isoform X2 n=1 Tax=Microplitis mediator TaxID=375433 RepID=UPI002553F022|nr:putative uncharacterized protein DDB_G0282133 isoform X2 [Microplitis mediator]